MTELHEDPTASPPFTVIVAVLDESGSMLEAKGDTIAAYNRYRDVLQENTSETSFSLLTFHSEPAISAYRPGQNAVIRIAPANVGVLDIPELNDARYSPDGGTPLNDALAAAISHAEKQVAGRQNGRVLIVVLTDGKENTSQEFREKASIKALVDRKQAEGFWTFVYLGATMDAFEEAEAYGFMRGNTVRTREGAQGLAATMDAFAGSTRSYRVGAQSAMPDFVAQNEAEYRSAGAVMPDIGPSRAIADHPNPIIGESVIDDGRLKRWNGQRWEVVMPIRCPQCHMEFESVADLNRHKVICSQI